MNTGNLEASKLGDPINRVDGRLKVTGKAKYAAEYQVPNIAYGVLVGSTIAKGKIKSINVDIAGMAPGIIKVITFKNSIKVPGYQTGTNPEKPTDSGQPLRVFFDNTVAYNGHPVALVIADTLEKAQFAARLVKVEYDAVKHETNLDDQISKAYTPKSPRFADYVRGTKEAYKNAAVKIESEYDIPVEVHNPMELHSLIALWEGDDKITVYDKTQGTKPSQKSIADAFKLPEENVQVLSKFVGGAFGSALRTWPHVIAAIIGSKMVGRPVKLVLTREQMFNNVGYRPYTKQKIGLGATSEGKLVGLSHQALAQTSSYEEFTEGTIKMGQMFYECPNVDTQYKIVPLDISTPTWMRGPGEATGAFAIECAMDELAHALHLDPLEFRIRNHADKDPEKKLPWSSKHLKEAYALGAEKIGWHQRNPLPGSMKSGEWMVGYGMGSGCFNASRRTASATARINMDGTLLIRSAASDIGPGTTTSFTEIAADVFEMDPAKVIVELGDSKLPPAPNQGGSTTTSTVGSAVNDACLSLIQRIKLLAIAKSPKFKNAKTADLQWKDGAIRLVNDSSVTIQLPELLKQADLPYLESTLESKGGDEQKNFSMYSFSVHFVEVHVHPLTGVVRVHRAVTVADAGTIVSPKTAASQMIGGVAGGIGMALTEVAVMDHRYGRYVTKDLADYHVPVHADVPHVDVIFVNKPDPYINPMGAKGMGEIAIIGFAPAVANAVFHATGKRIRELPITPDKLL